MLNLKKGLAVALAAATALTFAPVSAFAGTVTTQTTETNTDGSVKNRVVQTVTMNSTASEWTYGDNVVKGERPAASTTWDLASETDAVIVLTPSNPTGRITYTEAVTSKDTYANGVWMDDTAAQATTDNKPGILKFTAGKNSKSIEVTADMGALRSLGSTPKAYTVDQQTPAAEKDNKFQLADADEGLSFTVILVPHAVQMNNLKVTLSTASDTALDRYTDHGTDKYVLTEARPEKTLTSTEDLKFSDTVLENTFESGDNIYNPTRTEKEATDTQTLNLANSSKDKTFKVESNADVTYKSDDDSIATIDVNGIHAKKVGTTIVSITTKQSLTAYGDVTVKIPVEVINKPAATLTGPDDLYIHGYDVANAVKVGVTGTNIVKNSIKYTFVYWDAATQSWIDFSKKTIQSALNPYVMDNTSDSVYVRSYTGTTPQSYDWGAYLEATADAADGYVGPDPKYIRLYFDNSDPFELDATSQTLHVGESVQITAKTTRVATGAAFAYKSWNPAVATVSSEGAIKAVGEGSTTVDVSYGGYTKHIAVTVKEYEAGKTADGKPVQVTGLTVKNKKGAAVKVTFDASSIKNVKYYVQKKVSGKTSGKSVGSNKTTLSVKKGATVKVRVKAYYYDAAGNKLVGSYSAWKSLKTDKK